MLQKLVENLSLREWDWWTRPCGGREVMALAIPLVISAMSFTVMHFCDRMFLAWHSTNEMTAAGMAGGLNWTVFSFPLGVASYAATFVAQYFGSGDQKRIGAVVWQSALITLIATPLFVVTAWFSPQIFAAFGHPEELLKPEVVYFRLLAVASPAIVLSAAQAAFFIGRGQARPVMNVNIAAAVLNIGLDYWWIFGGAGIPPLGIEGAAWATAVSQWFKVFAFLALMCDRETVETFGLRAGLRWNGALLNRLLYFGGPSGLQFLVEGFGFTLIFLMIGRLGETPAAATTIAMNINMMAFVPMIGMGGAVSTLVGQQIGKGNPDLASRATWTGCWLALIYTSIFGFAFIFLPTVFVAMFGADSANSAEVGRLATILLRFVAAYCMFDAIQIIFVCAIKGAGDTRFVLVTTLITSSIVVVAGVFGAAYWDWSLWTWWYLITAWITLLAMIYVARFMQGKWRSMRVIEPDLIKPAGTLIAEVPAQLAVKR